MNEVESLKQWITQNYSQLTEKEVEESQQALTDLFDWWASVCVESALTEMENEDIVKE